MDLMALFRRAGQEVEGHAVTRPLLKRRRTHPRRSQWIRSKEEEDSDIDSDDGDDSGDEADEANKGPAPPANNSPPSFDAPIDGGMKPPERTLTPTIPTTTVPIPIDSSAPTNPLLAPIQSLITKSATSTAISITPTSSASLGDGSLSMLPPLSTVSVTENPAQISSSIVPDPTRVPNTEPEAITTTPAAPPGPKMNSAVAAGISFGSIALVSLIIVGVYLFWRRRRSGDVENFNHFPPEKHLPPSPPDHIYDRAIPPLRTSAEIMDQAMTAVYAAEDGNHPGNRLSIDTTLSFDGQGRHRNAPEPVSPLSPTPERAPELQPVQITQQTTETWYGGTLFPPTNVGVYPPGQVPIDRYRVPSVAHTEFTEATESSWGTWNVNQANAHNKPKTWKERYLT